VHFGDRHTHGASEASFDAGQREEIGVVEIGLRKLGHPARKVAHRALAAYQLEEDARVVLQDEPETFFFGEGRGAVVDVDGERAVRSGGDACGENDPRFCHIAHERAVSTRMLTARLPQD
jgi:hypothetical protein